MAVSINSFVGLCNSSRYYGISAGSIFSIVTSCCMEKLQGKKLQMSRSYTGTSLIGKTQLTFSFGIRPDQSTVSAAKTGQFALDSVDKGSTDSEDVVSDLPPSESIRSDVAGASSQLSMPESPNGAIPSQQAGLGQSPSTNSPSTPKRSPLTARERLRAARVLSRYANAKPSKVEMGSKVLDAIKQSEGGKRRSGLPEAPTNLFDDSKRGMPKEGFTFQFPGGNDLLVIGFSFIFISTVMFATTYIVWKVGAIHFNEY